MEVEATKIGIIFGLLISTLLSALLPLFCLRLSSRQRRRLRRSNASDANENSWDRLCSCCHKQPAHDYHENKTILRNGSAKTTTSHVHHAKSRSKLVISILNCFAGGIFLGTSFVGLLPEIRESFQRFDIRWPTLTTPDSSLNATNGEVHETKQMPMAEIVVVGGLFFILCVEQGAHGWNHWKSKRKMRHRGNSIVGLRMSELGNRERRVEQEESDVSRLSSESSNPKPQHDHSGIRSLMLVATLSLHSLLEGVAIGLQDELSSILTIFVAVLFHKSLMAFSMGTNLVQAKQTVKKIVTAAAIFAFATPTGIAIGLIIKSTKGDDHITALVNTVLQALATGTFLYITFFEVLVKEFEAHGNRLAKVLSLFVGYGAILGSLFAHNG